MREEHISAWRHQALMKIDGKVVHNWLSLEVGRDLANLAGIFRAELAVPVPLVPGSIPQVGAVIEIRLIGQTVLKGWIEALNTHGDAQSLHVTISGRDVTGDLVDCTANPLGPVEYRKISLEALIGSLTRPFQISVSRMVETGEPFTLVALDHDDTVLGAIEHHSRQRGVLVTSDGIGGIVLTKAGSTHAEDKLVYPGGNVVAVEGRLQQRHSDHFVKGQFHSHEQGSAPSLHAAVKPGLTGDKTGVKQASLSEEAANCRFGYCVDDHVQRYRPIVYLSKTQSGASQAVQQTKNPPVPPLDPSLKQFEYHPPAKKRKKTPARKENSPYSLDDQAAWRMRTARAHASAYVYTVPGFATAGGDIWKPNQLVTVEDALHNIHGDMLIGAVTWTISDQHIETKISVVPPDAYDLMGDVTATPREGQRKRKN